MCVRMHMIALVHTYVPVNDTCVYVYTWTRIGFRRLLPYNNYKFY